MTQPATAPLRLVAYLRDSGGTEQDFSLEQQEAAIRAWCDQRGHQLTAIFKDEAVSGGSTVGRHGFEAMLQHLRTPGCTDQGLVIWKYNRFARDFDDAAYYKADLRRRGYTIHSLNDTIPEGSDGRLFEAAIDWMNQRYREDMGKDIRRGIYHMVRTYGGVPAQPPPGFTRQRLVLGKHRDGSPHIVHKWTPDPEQAPAVIKAWQLKARGATHRHIHQVTGLFKNSNSFSDFFRNPIYVGELHYGAGPDKIIIPDYCPPLIDRATWEKVQTINHKNARQRGQAMRSEPGRPNVDHPRRVGSRYLLSGLLHCAECGYLMSGSRSTNSYGKLYHHYLCHSRKDRYQVECSNRMLPRDQFDQQVAAATMDFLQHPALLQKLTALANEKKRFHHQVRLRLEALESERIGIEARAENLLAAIEASGHTPRLLERLKNLEVHQKELDLQIAEFREIPEPEPLTPEQISKALRLLAGELAKEPLQAKPILRGLIKKVTALRQGRSVTGDIEFFLPEKVLSMMHAPSRRAMPTIWIAAVAACCALVPP
ncbi:MAG: recombinase family protein [Anaerolineales bacterium]|nr:recombinase family protein [Anaerolineales bacterium]